MTMSPGLRKLAFTAHVAVSVGWVGAVAVFLAFAIVGLTSDDELTVRGVYVVMEPAAWLVLVPLAVASLLTGLVMSLGTSWGLVRHYWVVLKLLITVFSTSILLVYMRTFRQMAGVAADRSAALELVRNPSPLLHGVLALLLLLVATVLSVYKPLGMTSYGREKEGEQRQVRSTRPRLSAAPAPRPTGTPRWVYLSGLVALGVILLFVILHLVGGHSGAHWNLLTDLR